MQYPFLCGCAANRAYLVTAPSDTLTNGGQAATAHADGVKIVVTPNDWNGSPQNLSRHVTPLNVRIENHSKRPVRLAYEDFHLQTSRGKHLAALPPSQIRGTQYGENAPITGQLNGVVENASFTSSFLDAWRQQSNDHQDQDEDDVDFCSEFTRDAWRQTLWQNPDSVPSHKDPVRRNDGWTAEKEFELGGGLLQALRLGIETDQSIKNGEHVAAVFCDSLKIRPLLRKAHTFTVPFGEHRRRHFYVAAKLLRRMAAQEKAIKECRFALGKIQLVEAILRHAV